MHLKLLIPGPIELEDEVLECMGAPPCPHYGDDWVKVHNETVRLLQQVFVTTGRVFLMPGSGSLGLDAAIHSLFAPGERVAVGINGFFGNRCREILAANGITVVPVEAPPNQPLDPARFERLLQEDSSIAGVVVVHLETSTAVLNPVREIARMVRQLNRICLVDAISSLAGTELQMDDWNIDVCIGAPQKGLGGAAGLSLVAVNDRAWEILAARKEHARSWYLDLRRWQWYVENWGDWHPFPITMPTAVVLGLRAALRSLLGDGLAARLQHYQVLAKQLRSGLNALGMPLFVPEALMAPVLTAAYCPPGVTSGELIRYLEQEHQLKITGGFGEFKDRVIRVGHMGGVIQAADIEALLAAIRQFLAEHKKPV